MKTAWAHVADELERRNLGTRWLADKLGYSHARVLNWARRGLPAKEQPAVADVLGWSVERLLTGLGEGRQVKMSPLAVKVPLRLDAIADIDRFRAAYAVVMLELDRLDREWKLQGDAPPPTPRRRPSRTR